MLPRLLLLLPLLLLRPCAFASTPADFIYLSQGEVTPEGNNVTFGANENWYGRVHTNGQANVSMFGIPQFHSFFSQCAETVNNLSEQEYDGVFLDDWSIPYACVVWPMEDAIAPIRAACSPQHRWAAEDGGEALTTLLRFDHAEYRAAQYFTNQTAPGDTAFLLPWATYDLPQPPAAEPLIWVEGVGRLKGVVEGELTVLVSDSLFLMGDLIVADAILSPCGSEALFGTVPPDSPNRIGLIGEGDVIVAATLENGFANGEATPGVTCGLPNDDPVIASCGQDRMDVVVTAAILAAGCSFESEFWNTTASGASVPAPNQQDAVCGGTNNTHAHVWSESDCPGASTTSDRRGRIWLHGALANAERGFVIRTGGPWGANTYIGYPSKRYMVDTRLAEAPPPFWPELAWTCEGRDGEPAPCPAVEPRYGPNAPCGAIDDLAVFAGAWEAGATGVSVFVFSPYKVPVRFRVHAGETRLEDTLLVVDARDPEFLQWDWSPSVDPVAALLAGERVWISAESDFFDWNADGDECSWYISEAAEETPERPSTPALGFPYPNPFNPATRVTVTLTRPGTVRLALVDLLGREARVVREGPLPAGEHAIEIDGAGLPSGLYLLRLEREGGADEVRKALLLR